MGTTLDEMFDAPSPIAAHGISEDEAIRRFIELDRRVKEADAERAEYKAFLIEKAREQQSGQNTVHLESSTGTRVKVEFKKVPQCDQVELECARDLLGDERFMKIFKYSFKPKSRDLKTFLNTKFADERVTTAQQIIKDAIKDVDASPYVSIERGN